jgi:hypothetical protein
MAIGTGVLIISGVGIAAVFLGKYFTTVLARSVIISPLAVVYIGIRTSVDQAIWSIDVGVPLSVVLSLGFVSFLLLAAGFMYVIGASVRNCIGVPEGSGTCSLKNDIYLSSSVGVINITVLLLAVQVIVAKMF